MLNCLIINNLQYNKSATKSSQEGLTQNSLDICLSFYYNVPLDKVTKLSHKEESGDEKINFFVVVFKCRINVMC